MRAPGYAARLAPRARAHARRTPRAAARARAAAIAQRPGAGGLKTLRLDVVYGAAGERARARVPRSRLRRAHRLARDHALGPRRRPRRQLRRARARARAARCARTRRTCSARRSTSSSADGDVEPGDAPGTPPSIDAAPAPDARERRLRGADRAGRRSRSACSSLSLLDRGVLGRGARPHARPREGDGRRVPRRHAGDAAPRVHARRDGHGRPHRRRLRDRDRDARALPVHRPRAALSLADARLRPARRRGRRGGAAPAPRWRERAHDQHDHDHHGHDHTTITTATTTGMRTTTITTITTTA